MLQLQLKNIKIHSHNFFIVLVLYLVILFNNRILTKYVKITKICLINHPPILFSFDVSSMLSLKRTQLLNTKVNLNLIFLI